MKAKVLLINIPFPRVSILPSDNFFPIGLLSIATVLKHNNIDARIIDINNDFYLKEINDEVLNDYITNRLYPYIENYNPDIVGVSCLFSGAFKCLKVVAHKIKMRFPNIPIVIGGAHPSIFPRDVLERCSYIDYIIIGEGELSFLTFVEFFIKGNPNFALIDGIAFRDKGNITVIPKRMYIDKLDELPFVDYGILNLDNCYSMDTSNWYSPLGIKVGQPFPIMSSRSCPKRCNFCMGWLVHGPTARFRSADNVLDEMEYLYKDYNVRYFQFWDDNLTLNKERILEICNGIQRRGMKIQLDTPNGVAINSLDEEIIKAMVEAGLIRISVAIESGSEYIRNKVMKKGLKTEKIYEVVEALARYDHLFIVGFFIIGMPEETHETLRKTYEMITRLPLDAFSCFFATPYPGTELFNYCVDHKLLFYEANDYVEVEDLRGNVERPFFKPYELTVEDLTAFQKKCVDYLRKKRTEANLSIMHSTVPFRYRQRIVTS